MLSKTTRRALAVAVFTAMAAIPALGLARTTIAVNGVEEPRADKASCMMITGGSGFGRLTNECALGTVASTVNFPLAVDTSGNKYLSVAAISAPTSSPGKVCCYARSVSEDGIQQGYAGACNTAWGTWQDLSLGPVYVPTDGTVIVQCSVNPGSSIGSTKLQNP